jgi:hypothetical protein
MLEKYYTPNCSSNLYVEFLMTVIPVCPSYSIKVRLMFGMAYNPIVLGVLLSTFSHDVEREFSSFL